MDTYPSTIEALGIEFFGVMTASISHELKNVLAIVNENGGLLGDLAGLMERGRPLDPQRLHTVSRNIRNQVQRADSIIRRLNQFAHSAHDPAVQIDLREVCVFIAALAERRAMMRGVTITVEEGEPILLHLRPFVLENLLWICLLEVMNAPERAPAATVLFSARNTDGSVILALTIQADNPPDPALLVRRAEPAAQPLLSGLQAAMRADPATHSILLTLPRNGA